MPTNTAAWINAKHARFEVGPAPYSPPAADQLVIRNRAVAVNPLEWIIQVDGNLTYRWLKYPTVLGSDTAGEVAEVGSTVTRFRPGDRVLGHAVGTDRDSNSAAEGTFQHYSVVLERMAAPLPDTLAFEDAAVLPLATSTAASGLFGADQLGLRRPSADASPAGETVLVWGGSTSVGSCAIQLAAAAGYEVITTASPRNFEYVKSLGATQAFDYRDPAVVPDIIAALKGQPLAGAVALGPTAAPACVRIASVCAGRKAVAIATPPADMADLAAGGRLAVPRLVGRLITGNVALMARARARGVQAKYIWGTALKTSDLAAAIYQDFLPGALADGRYVAAPKPVIAGHGLEKLQEAMDVQRAGVSAAKVVVTLP
jgi:NADPH:quinone reductase-like Zn-dependent oxidoreductase